MVAENKKFVVLSVQKFWTHLLFNQFVMGSQKVDTAIHHANSRVWQRELSCAVHRVDAFFTELGFGGLL